MQRFRNIYDSELKILKDLINLSNIEFELPDPLVNISGDEGLYSIIFSNKITKNEKRIFGKKISEVIFKDYDGIDVIASLYTDTNDELYEIDFWKVDYTTIRCLDK
ncbi:MAG TPA: hypothetical protein VF677_01600 [Flavobacterium sp.]|jgi:hypothetical protein